MGTSNYETVTIPTTSNPFRVIVNGVEYKYEAGATVEVPPEVAAAINASVNAASDLVKPGEVKPPFGASGGSGGGVQTDWNQTDETAPDFIKNKPFGEEETVIMEEQELPFDEEGQGFIGSVSSPVTIGVVLKVVYNGTTYELITYDFMGRPAFGNATILGPGMGADTGEPFWGVFYQADGAVVFMQHDLESPTVKISRVDVTKLPSKYNDTQTVFYIGEQDNYLYVDGARTVKATENDLDVVRAKPITLNYSPHFLFYSPISVTKAGFITNGKLGTVITVLDINGTQKKYYTAEYTP